jgi:membrane-bound lytic murein transglycosylase B
VARAGATLLAAALLAGLAIVAGDAIARADLPQLDGRIPQIAYDAYRAASEQAGAISHGCSVDWTVLAGLGRVESRHGLFEPDHRIEANGDVTPAIRGPQLDGTGGTRSIADTDGGAIDGDPIWDRAMGPLQFIPTTWAQLGRDGNADGLADPDNLYDAAVTAAAHLCLRVPG